MLFVLFSLTSSSASSLNLTQYVYSKFLLLFLGSFDHS